ncbi:MAG TPA: P-II family nitrogen regulator [Thiotrichales bacterium]|nr:P-II family nitrogen regulator [Thiotrichales bacterium]
MKEIKAFVHRNRAADVIHALKDAGFLRLSLIDTKGTLRALDKKEQEYSLELGARVITEVKLELVCQDGEVDRAVALIRENGRTGQPEAGWIFVTGIEQAIPIDGGDGK